MPIPAPPVQRTKAEWSLTVLQAVLDVYSELSKGTDPLARQLQKIIRWHKECGASLQRRDGPLSAGAKRDMNRRIAALAPYMETEDMEKDARAERWAALWWTALSELISARGMCPIYCAGRNWAYLEQTMTTLCEKMLLPLWPDCDVTGTQISLELP